jgi:hypothetical protein
MSDGTEVRVAAPRYHREVKQLSAAKRKDYEDKNGRLEKFGKSSPEDRFGADIKEAIKYEEGWGDYLHNPGPMDDKYNTQELRDGYVYDDGRTLRYNRMLRAGKIPSNKSWVEDTDLWCTTSYIDKPCMVYRGACLEMPTIAKILSEGSYTEPAFMSTGGNEAEARSYVNIRHDEFPGNQKVIFYMLANPKSKHMNVADAAYSEYVFPRGKKFTVTGMARPSTLNDDTWQIFGELE